MAGVGAALRLSRDDLADPSLASALELTLSRLGLDPAFVDLLLDFREVEWQRLGSSALAAFNAIRSLPWISTWRHVILAATNAPASLREFEPNEITPIPRTEVRLYRELERRRDELPRLPVYADYAIAHPDPVEDLAGAARNMSTQFRYSTDEALLIVKGARFVETSGSELPALLGRLIAGPDFPGPVFSAGDQWVTEVAAGNAVPGTARQWREAGTNHHLTLEIKRRFASPLSL